MARLPRLVAPGVPHHITQRGNRRQRVFFSDADYRWYLELLEEWCFRDGVAILSYCLMPNHIHLIAVPSTIESLTHSISEVHRRYSQAINRRKRWVGHLWQGRYSSFPLSEEHLYHAMHYVEQNPVKVSLVAFPEEWEWSSACEQTGRSQYAIVDHAMLRRFALSIPSVPCDPEAFAAHARTGRPMGNDDFIKQLEAITGREISLKKVLLNTIWAAFPPVLRCASPVFLTNILYSLRKPGSPSTKRTKNRPKANLVTLSKKAGKKAMPKK